jgi:beta-galactosidase
MPGRNSRQIIFCALAILGGTAAAARAVETVRVDASSGAPRILVDGKPVRARVFFGNPGIQWPTAPATGQLLTFEFSPTEEEPAHAAIHFRFDPAPGDIYLDDVCCTDLDTGKEVFPPADFEAGTDGFRRNWNVWPSGPQNTVGTVAVEPGKGRDGSAALHVALKNPTIGYWPDFHIYRADLALHKGHHYRVRLWARAEPRRDLKITFHRGAPSYVLLAQPPDPFPPQIKLAAQAGVDLVSFSVELPWPKPGEPVDWSRVDAVCQTVLDANPKALLLPRIQICPPWWWYQLHPDDKMVWEPGAPGEPDAVVASPVFRRDVAERLAAVVAHLEDKFGPHVAGYHPGGQNSAEWFYQHAWSEALNGYAKADLATWRAWLAARYPNDAALQSAWHNPQVTLQTAAVPPSMARRTGPAGVLRDPTAERSLIDFNEYQQEAMADCVCHLAKTVRQASHGRKLVLFFYGYGFEMGSLSNYPASSGHYALRRVLNSPDIDILCSPISYFDRGLGGNGPAMTAAESVALAGKMWLHEDDTRTCRSGVMDCFWLGDTDTLEKTNWELVRNTAQCAVRNFGTWWMDLYGTGWFNEPGMWTEMAKFKNVDDPLLRTPRPFRPEVAAIIDEPTMIRVAAGGQVVTTPGVCEVRRPLGRMGAPFGQYLQDDVAAGRVKAKMYVFLTAWCLSPAQRQQLLQATRGALRIWCYAPGFQEENRTSLDAMRELTGFQMKKISSGNAWAEPTDAGRKLGLTEGFGVRGPIRPLFAAADATAVETLATYPDGSAAVALRKTADGWSLFVGPPGLSSHLLRLAAGPAGVHLFTTTDCNVYANGPLVVVHASQDGPLEIDTGAPGPIHDLFTGQLVGQGPKLTLPLRNGETRVLRTGAM